MLPIMRPDEFSRCDERIQQGDPGKVPGLTQRTDISIKGSVERAIWNDDVLRAIEYNQIDVHVKDGIVHLNGHVANASSWKRIEKAVRAVPAIRGIRNHLVLDEKLTLEVAGSLGILEHTYDCKFFTGASYGVVSLNGVVRNENVKSLAEKCASKNPNVRAVINHVRVSGDELDVTELPFLQPVSGETIYFLDGVSGVVKQVIVNPDNRRVIAMTVRVWFANQQQDLRSLNHRESGSPEQLVVISMDAVRYLTRASGFLNIKSNERERYMDFDPSSFVTPSAQWTPPYPYCSTDVLFPVEYQAVDVQSVNATHLSSSNSS